MIIEPDKTKSQGENNNYLPYWMEAEKSPQPRYVRGVKIIDFSTFGKKVYTQDDSFVQELVRSLYAGDCYILRNAFSHAFFQRIKRDLCEWWKQENPLFHKMVEGVPNHHRIIDEAAAGKYGLESIRHSHFFFPFNTDPFKVFDEINPVWQVIKFLGGFSKTEYEKNTPKDGVIDRIHFIHYPAGTGRMQTHSDPYLNQRVFTGGIMTKRGKDYQKGGVYLVNERHQKVDVEPLFEIGDFYIAYPTLYHGVDLVDEECAPDWTSANGRWFLGLYSNDSDMVEKRHTVDRVTIPLKEGEKVIPKPTFI